MTYQMTAAQQEVLDNQSDNQPEPMTATDERVMELVDALLKGASIQLHVTYYKHDIAQLLAEDIAHNETFQQMLIEENYGQALTFNRNKTREVATDLINEYIDDYGVVPRLQGEAA